MARQRSVLIIVQNLPVPLDRRVWLECQALRDDGYQVSVICPRGEGEPRRQVLDKISLYKYQPAPQANGFLGYVFEFVYCWIRTALLSLVVHRHHRFDVIQACNPPDTYWALARLWRRRGVRFVFDQHDLNPELFRSRFGEPTSLAGRLQLRTLLWLERRTYAAADHVISTNDSYRRIAVDRGGLDPRDVTVVRSGPDTTRLRPVAPEPSLRRGAEHLLVYLGIMGPQDNVDVLLDVVAGLVRRRGATSVHLALLGFGDCLESLKRQAREMGVEQHVTFTGRADEAMIRAYLSTASVGLAPDLKTPLNDVSTHNKVMEYMACGLPVVSFDIEESRISAADCAAFVASGDVEAYVTAVERLLDDDDLRESMGGAARERSVDVLDWRHQVVPYRNAFRRVLGDPPVAERVAPPTAAAGSAGPGDAVIDLREPSTAAERVS